MGRHSSEYLQKETDMEPIQNTPTVKSEPVVAKAPVDPVNVETTKTEEAPTSYTFVRGDTLRSVAARFGLSPSFLVRINAIEDVNAIKVGQSIKLKA